MGKLHCLDVGCADSSIIVSDNHTFLVDCYNIDEYTHLLPKNKILKGVFVTHQHDDHFHGLHYLKENGYKIENLIYSPYNRRYSDNSVTIDEWNDFERLKQYFIRNGTETYSPYRQENFDEPFWSIDGIRFEIIGPHKDIADSPTRELHDACLVIGTYLGNRRCLFAGDASDQSLRRISDSTNNFCNDILHASHHGSINGAELEFIKKCNIKYTLISTKSGVHSNVPHQTALRRYKDNTEFNVIRTDNDGSWTWEF